MKRTLLRFVFVLLAALLVGSYGLSYAFKGGWARRELLSRLSAGFGRPVEVGDFGFSILGGPRLEARSVTVAEDPRFGSEYFLRADRLTASVRWSALIQGRIEFDTVSLTRPSLNLVRLSDGQWNIENWLPPLPGARNTRGRSSAAGPADRATSSANEIGAARLSRVDVDTGRINFKRDTRKLPLALINVNGRFDHGSAGQWNIDVQANAMRAPASLQQAGMLRVRGVVGGISTRLRPARLELGWENASLADLSRLVRGDDLGVRGTLDADLTASIDDSQALPPSWGEWSVEGKVRLQGMHGWALAGRTDDPTANINLEARWRPADYRLMVTRCVVEAPHSQLAATLNLDWSHGFQPSAQILSSRMDLADLLAWRRAFHIGVADDLGIEGAVKVQANLSGWPARIENLSVDSEAATVRAASLPAPIRIGPLAADWSEDTLKVRKLAIDLPIVAPSVSPTGDSLASAPPRATSILVADGTLGPLPAINALSDFRYRWNFSGDVPRVQDLFAIVRAWGAASALTWTAEGPLSLQLAVSGTLEEGSSSANGTVQARGIQIISEFVDRPLLVTGTVDLRGNERRVKLRSAEAIGAHWTGTLQTPAEKGEWNFDLSADRIDAAEFYKWFASKDSPNLLQRMLPFAAQSNGGQTGRHVADLGQLQARGRLRVAELVFSPLHINKIDAAVSIDGPSLILNQGRAELFGGHWNGKMEVRLTPTPVYSFDGQYSRVDLAKFADGIALKDRASGLASGDLNLSARGLDRSALIATVQGQGTLRSRDCSLGPIEFTWTGASSSTGTNIGKVSADMDARFQIEASRIKLDQLLVRQATGLSEIFGNVDFSRRLNLHVQPSSRSSIATSNTSERASWSITGTLDAPVINSDKLAETGRRTGASLTSH